MFVTGVGARFITLAGILVTMLVLTCTAATVSISSWRVWLLCLHAALCCWLSCFARTSFRRLAMTGVRSLQVSSLAWWMLSNHLRSPFPYYWTRLWLYVAVGRCGAGRCLTMYGLFRRFLWGWLLGYAGS